MCLQPYSSVFNAVAKSFCNPVIPPASMPCTTVATSLVVLRWLCDSPRMGCAWRITPLWMWCEQAIIEWSRWSDLGEWPLTMLVNLVNSWLCLRMVTTRVISSGDLYCCLLPRCEALRTCHLGFPIATLRSVLSVFIDLWSAECVCSYYGLRVCS